jgi:chromosome segregation ATPase
MADFAEIEQRMTAALARIRAGIDDWPKPVTAPSAAQAAHIAHLEAQLDHERAARSPKAEPALFDLGQDSTAEVARVQRQLDEADLENQRLHTAIGLLRQDLRLMEEQAEANLAKLGDANAALQAELDALTQARAAETAEIAKILAALAPLVDVEEARSNA